MPCSASGRPVRGGLMAARWRRRVGAGCSTARSLGSTCASSNPPGGDDGGVFRPVGQSAVFVRPGGCRGARSWAALMTLPIAETTVTGNRDASAQGVTTGAVIVSGSE